MTGPTGGKYRKRPSPVPSATGVTFDGEIVVYCERAEQMHCLDRPASVVWALCDGTRDIDQIVDGVAELAGREPVSVRGDVEAAVAKFRELGIVK